MKSGTAVAAAGRGAVLWGAGEPPAVDTLTLASLLPITLASTRCPLVLLLQTHTSDFLTLITNLVFVFEEALAQGPHALQS